MAHPYPILFQAQIMGKANPLPASPQHQSFGASFPTLECVRCTRTLLRAVDHLGNSASLYQNRCDDMQRMTKYQHSHCLSICPDVWKSQDCTLIFPAPEGMRAREHAELSQGDIHVASLHMQMLSY